MESLANPDPPESAQEHIQMCEKHFLRKDITCDDCDEFICKQCAKTDHVDHDWTTISTDASIRRRDLNNYDFKVNEGKWIARNRQDKDGRETNLRQPETFWYWDFKASETL